MCICYYTFWSDVADLSARGGRADKLQHHNRRNVYYRLLGGSASFPGNAAASARFPVHGPYTGPFMHLSMTIPT